MAIAAEAPLIEHIERRRSERVPLHMTLMVCGQSSGKGPFKEETVTLSRAMGRARGNCFDRINRRYRDLADRY